MCGVKSVSVYRPGEASSEARAVVSIKQEPSSSSAPLYKLWYRCEACTYVTNRMWHLKRHQALHTRDNRFACHLCPMTFDLKEDMVTHVRTHNMQRYQCKLCPRSFNLLRSLARHAKCHTFLELTP
ncbi:hypothetical protein HPB49_002406 [Dermacentor silvarum]|uniref:Uncharacterized protein n=1 Tax=Dermacentor silvarum TaxID=543639 RepID=A0ACB8DM87_DERSI|nr:hypothetical protein HPB49_002406 [Dermacentor silvarum]